MTPGQQEVLNIVAKMSPKHYGVWKDLNCPFYSQFTENIRNNKIIAEDNITGRSSSNFDFSSYYIDWIMSNSSTIELRNNFPRISLDLFDYYRAGRRTHPAYMGGDKFDTTYSCLFSLYKNIPLSPNGWGLRFIESEGYSTISGYL